MTADMVSELLRQLMRESLILAAPVLVMAVLLSFVLSLVQTLTSLQDQSSDNCAAALSSVRLILLAGMPWFLGRMSDYTRALLFDLHRYLGSQLAALRVLDNRNSFIRTEALTTRQLDNWDKL